MSQFDHTLFFYMSLETTKKDRFFVSRRIELPSLKCVLGQIIVTCQLVEIGAKSLVWGLLSTPGRKPWQRIVVGNVGGLL
ncbi:MAG: hypothetical protein AAF485_19210 [Chloroflexota bacterium]